MDMQIKKIEAFSKTETAHSLERTQLQQWKPI